MAISITHTLSDWDQANRIPNGGLRIAINGERIHRFDPDNRPAEARQDWGPEYLGVYPDQDLPMLLDTVQDVIEGPTQTQQSMRRGVRFCECEVEFRFERLTEKYIRLAVSSKWALPEVQRGYLVTTDELATELDAAISRFLSEVDAEGSIENNPAEGLHRQRDEFAEDYL